MKSIYILVTICLLMSGLLPSSVKAVDPYYIEGIVRKADNNQTVPYTDVYLTNERTEEQRGTTTDANGSYQFNLDDFQDGWISGDYWELAVAAPSGYSSYGLHILTDITLFPFYTWHVDSTVWPENPNPPWSDYVLDSFVASRQDTVTFKWLVDWGDNIYPSQSGGTIWLKFGYYCYDDSYTDLPNQNDVFDISITCTFAIWDQNNNNNTIAWDSDTMDYTTYYGNTECRVDPILTISLQHDYDMHQLTLRGQIDLSIVDHFNTNYHYSSYEWSTTTSISDVRYDW